MTLSEESNKGLRVAIVGLGQQGSGIVRLLSKQGHSLVGAVDIGQMVGRRVDSVVAGVETDAVVVDSVKSLLASTNSEIDVVILAASVGLDTTLEQATLVMRAGVNVLTLQQDLFEPLSHWADALQSIGKATGASLLSTGVQDTWWVQMPAVAAASTTNVREVRIDHLIDLESIAPNLMTQWGIGVAEAEFAPFKAADESLPPILGAPLRLAARAMGLTPGPVTTTIEPVVSTEEITWQTAARHLPAGSVVGTEEITEFVTDEGVKFRGSLVLRALTPGERPSDTLTIDADPALRLEHKPFPGQQVTNIALVARIPDVVAAPGGVLNAADLGPARYRPPLDVPSLAF